MTEFLLAVLVPPLVIVGVPFASYCVWLWWDDRCHRSMMGAKWDGFIDGLDAGRDDD